MGESTAIGWTDHTFNPWWGCSRVSPGCANCYAEAFAKRTGHQVWGDRAERRDLSDANWRKPEKWNADAAGADRPALVFCASMADVFEDRDDLEEPRARLWALIERTPHLRWQLLTKRPENVLGMVPPRWIGYHEGGWPRHVWIGTTVEDERRASERIPTLLSIPAPVRFLSCEPLLEELRLPRYLFDGAARRRGMGGAIDWIIVGGESGPRHRPFDPRWARIIFHDANAANVPVFFKQHGGRTPKAGGELLDGYRIQQFPAELATRSIFRLEETP